jgi:hypothetical protein
MGLDDFISFGFLIAVFFLGWEIDKAKREIMDEIRNVHDKVAGIEKTVDKIERNLPI